MTGGRAFIGGLFGALALTAGAQAADPAGSWPPPAISYEKPEPRFKELLSGYYLRGDIGYRWNDVGSFAGAVPATSFDYRNGGAIGGGFGYKYEWFRADLTVDRGARTNFSGTTATAARQPQYTAKIDTLSVLANAYVDIGTWGGFTPYVGGGVGVTQLKSSGYQDTGFALGSMTPGKAKNFTWAWMAGVSYKIHPYWMVDIGYRHMDMGNLPATSSSLPGLTVGNFQKVTADEVRIGLRLLFD